MTLDFFEKFRQNLDGVADQIAFELLSESGRETFTYRQVGEEIRSISRYLQSSGIGPDSTVGIIMENHPRWGIAFLAAQSAGSVLVPFDIQHDTETLAGLVEHSECDFLICSTETLPAVKEIREILEKELPLLVVGECGGEYPEWSRIVRESPAEDASMPLVSRDLDDPNLIMYTSGTTGNPKGVVLSFRNVYRNVVEILRRVEVGDQDNLLGVLPLYHILALMVNFVIPLYCGARVTYLDAIDAQRILKAFREEGVTIFVVVPQFYYLVHRRILQEVSRQSPLKRFLFHRLLALSRFCNRRLGWNPGKLFFGKIHRQFGPRFRIFGVGGARFDKDVAETFRDLGFTIVQAYGMTETGAVATMTSPHHNPIGSVGFPLPHVEIAIGGNGDEGGGEVLIRGENIMQGYFKNPEATRETIDSEGWLHSGDLGYLSEKGALYITGRKKDVIVLSSGKNIYPEEIEQFYQKHCEFIKEICVVGISDVGDQEQERLHAVIVPDFELSKKEQVVNAGDMIRYMMESLSQKLPPHKRVRSFDIWQNPLPRTTTRKIRRFEIEQLLKDRRQSEPQEGPVEEDAEPRNPAEARVFEEIRQIKKNAVIRPEKNLELDIGLDSLERVEFLANLQDIFQFEVTDEEASRLFTVENVTELLQEKLSEGAAEQPGAKKSWNEILNEELTEEERATARDRLRRRSFVEWAYVFLARVVWLLLKIFFRLKVEGKENLPRQLPFMICPNHVSFLDALVVVTPLPAGIIQQSYSLGYSDYFGKGILGFFGRLIKVIPVDSDRQLRKALRMAAEGLRRNRVLIVFPEGERSIDGRLKAFRKGTAILATQLQVPAVPVGISGAFQAWRRGSNKIRLHPITVRFGKPVQPKPEESIEQFNDRLFESVNALIED